MNWIKTIDKLPQVDDRTGESDYVIAYLGSRMLPLILKYSDGSVTEKGWWTTDYRHIPFLSGKGKVKHLSVTHWAEIEYPEDYEATSSRTYRLKKTNNETR